MTDMINDNPDDDQGVTLSNFDRLQTHLTKDSLAALLLAAYVNPAEGGEQVAMENIVASRIEARKRQYDEPKNPKA